MSNGGISIGRYPATAARLNDLIAVWPYLPYSACKAIEPHLRGAYLLDSINSSAAKGAATLVANTESGETKCLLQFEKLAWDTSVLGFPVWRISWMLHRERQAGPSAAMRELLKRALAEVQQQGARYLVARTSSLDVAGIHLLEESGFQLVDGLITFGRTPPMEPLDLKMGDFSCELAQPADAEELARIAGTSFLFDRFHMDPAVPHERADELHREWVRNSCAGLADAVLVLKTAGEVAGFTTLKCDKAAEKLLGVKIGTVVLVATAEAHRGRGVGRLLTQASADWFRQQRCDWCEVGTQLANAKASRLYQSAGFQLVASSLTFRRLF